MKQTESDTTEVSFYIVGRISLNCELTDVARAMNISFLHKYALALVHFKSSTYFILGDVNICPLKLMNQREEDISG